VPKVTEVQAIWPFSPDWAAGMLGDRWKICNMIWMGEVHRWKQHMDKECGLYKRGSQAQHECHHMQT